MRYCDKIVVLDFDEEYFWVMRGKVQDLSVWLKYCEEVGGGQGRVIVLYR